MNPGDIYSVDLIDMLLSSYRPVLLPHIDPKEESNRRLMRQNNELRQRVEDLERQVAELKGGAS